jgi:hypothetical protein
MDGRVDGFPVHAVTGDAYISFTRRLTSFMRQ